MRKQIYIILFLVIVPTLTILVASYYSYSELKKIENVNVEGQYKIIFYNHGSLIPIDNLNEDAKRLKNEIERIFISSHTILKELVTQETIDKIINNEYAIEIVYNKPKKFFTKNIVTDHLLIPLSGHFVGAGSWKTTIFIGYPYKSGPFASKADVSLIIDILNKMGYKISL